VRAGGLCLSVAAVSWTGWAQWSASFLVPFVPTGSRRNGATAGRGRRRRANPAGPAAVGGVCLRFGVASVSVICCSGGGWEEELRMRWNTDGFCSVSSGLAFFFFEPTACFLGVLAWRPRSRRFFLLPSSPIICGPSLAPPSPLLPLCSPFLASSPLRSSLHQFPGHLAPEGGRTNGGTAFFPVRSVWRGRPGAGGRRERPCHRHPAPPCPGGLREAVHERAINEFRSTWPRRTPILRPRRGLPCLCTLIFGVGDRAPATTATPSVRHHVDVAAGNALAPAHAEAAVRGDMPAVLEAGKVGDFRPCGGVPPGGRPTPARPDRHRPARARGGRLSSPDRGRTGGDLFFGMISSGYFSSSPRPPPLRGVVFSVPALRMTGRKQAPARSGGGAAAVLNLPTD